MSAMLGRMYFEFEDSEVGQISLQDGALQIRFSAARLYDGQSTGAGNGLWQALLLICKQPASENQWLEPDLTQILSAMGRVQWAQLQIDGARVGGLPMPFDTDASFALALEFAGGLGFELKGRGMALQAVPDQCSVSSYQCG